MATLARQWPSVNGRVLVSRISMGDSDTQDSLQLLYAYEFAGIERTSFDIDLFELPSMLTTDEIKLYTQKYPEGSSVKVYCNPLTGSGVLEPENTVGTTRTRNLGIFILIIGSFFVANAIVHWGN